MADVGKMKAEDNQVKENENESGSESETEEIEKDKKSSGDKNKKKNAAPAPAKIKPPAKKRVKAEQAEENKKEKDKDSKKKKPAAKVKEEEEDDDEGGDDEESDNEENGVPEKVPLLDQPLEITGSRERKQVQRFIPKEELKNDSDKKVEIPDGKGKPLGEIPRIQFQLNKLKADALKNLHRVLYNRVGQPNSIKKNIQKFKGFDFEKESSEYKRKLSLLTKIKNTGLKTLCTILDLKKVGKHAELAEKILDFLLLPEDSGKEVPDPRPKRKGITSKSYKEAKADEDDAKKGRSKGSPGKKKSKASSDEEQDDEEEEEEESDEKKTEDENEEEEENDTVVSEEEKPKKATKRAPAKKTAANSASIGKKGNISSGTTGSSNSKKGKEKEPKSESETENQSDVDDDEPVEEPPVKKTKSPPTDDEIKSYVKSVLEGANLEEITMKTVCKKVYEHYPDFDLGYKKEFIKNTVKSLISS